MSTIAAKGRGDKREYLYADDSTQLRSSTMDRSLETFPKSIHYPVSRDTISPVDPKKPIYLDQVNTYIHTYPTPTPSISTQRRSPKNHHHHHQRSIDRFTPKSVLTINISNKNPSQPNPNHAPLPPPLPPPPPPLPPHHRPKTPPRLHLAQPHPNHPSTLQIQLLHQTRPARKRSRPQHNAQSQPPRGHFLFFGHQNWRNYT